MVSLVVDYACLVLVDEDDQALIDESVQVSEPVGSWAVAPHVVQLSTVDTFGAADVTVVLGAPSGGEVEGMVVLGSEVVELGPEVFVGTIDMDGENVPQHVLSLGRRGKYRVT